jgi:hypothetical protein
MPIQLKGSKVKKLSGGSGKDKSVKLKDIKDLVEKKPTAAVVVSAKGAAAAALAGAKFKMTLPGGKSQSGVIDGSGGMGAQLEKEGNTKLEFTSLTDDLKKAR